MNSPSSAVVLAINARDPEELRIALAEGSALLEARSARAGVGTRVGDLYLAEVVRTEPGLDAAFLDFGGNRAGFMHIGNLHPACLELEDPIAIAEAPMPGSADPSQQEEAIPSPSRRVIADLAPGTRLIVQVLRDAVRGKGCTLTTMVSLAGSRLVWMPSMARAAASRRLSDPQERDRLRDVLEELRGPDGPGLIARTSAAQADASVLKTEFLQLQEQWQQVVQTARKLSAPGLLWREPSPTVRFVRDLLRPGIQKIVVDDPATCDELETFLAKLDGDVPPVRRWDRSRPLFEALDLEADWQRLYRSRVGLTGGASIVIHETEALTAIDVNSGRMDEGSLEETALATNRLAAVEIARQIRLRDLGGILVVDFIDMGEREHREGLEDAFREALNPDRARMKVARLGAFGLLSLTRRRLGSGPMRSALATCSSCAGTGNPSRMEAAARRILRRLRACPHNRSWSLRAHPRVLECLQVGGELEAMQEQGLEVHFEPDSQLIPEDPVLR